jgi:hypothetical protein
VKDAENLKRIASGLIDDEVGKNPVEKHVPAREIGAAMAAVWDAGQSVKALEEFSDDPIRRFHALLLKEEKPNRVNIKDGIFGKLKRVQGYQLRFARWASLNPASFRCASPGP